jgi:hypothetical protein
MSCLKTAIPFSNPACVMSCVSLHRKIKKYEADEIERKKAIEEAQVYLPR